MVIDMAQISSNLNETKFAIRHYRKRYQHGA